MKPANHPRSAFYDGRLYAALIEPFQGRLHRRLAELIDPGSTVIDACCGAGALPLHLAGKCARVTGVDRSPRQIKYADSRRRRDRLEHVSFKVVDATDLGQWPDGAFDVATIVLALHEMPAAQRVPTLRELGRVSRRIIAVDYAVPLPRNLVRLVAWMAELAAGPRHFAAFRNYLRRGGLEALFREAGLPVAHRERLEGGGLALYIC